MALVALSVGLSVVLVGLTAYATASVSLYAQLDNELETVAAYEAGPISADITNLGGLSGAALRAANVRLLLLRSDGALTRVPGEEVLLQPGDAELTIARTQQGASARTVNSDQGVPYRMVALPMTVGDADYAIVIARPLAPTLATLVTLRNVMGLVGWLGVILSAAVGWVIGRQGMMPVRQLSDAVTHVTETDELAPIKIQSNDELGDLTRSFNTMLNALKSSRDRQRRLIADASHELRTPLTSMRTNIELLVADEQAGMLPPGARSEILRDIAAQLGEFTSLVGDLVQLSREERVTASREPLDFRDVVQAAVVRAKRRGPMLTFDVELDPLFIVGEPDTLERAVTNLLDNAVKFSPSGGTIHVQLQGDQLRIADQGPGIADEDIPFVFDRFYRSDRSRNTPGTGLGLSIVAHTITAHGGSISVGRSAEGGAEFIVTLPSAQPEADVDPADTGSQPAAREVVTSKGPRGASS